MPYKNKLVGIYKITNIVNDKIYVGQSIAIKQRWSQHKAELRKNKHGNCHLQKAWNKYGEEKFKFSVLEYLDTDISKDFLTEREQYWIDYYDSSNIELGYNICKFAASHAECKVSEETKRKISIATRQKWDNGSFDINQIKCLTHNMIEKYGIEFYVFTNKLTKEQVLEIKEMILKGISDVEISDIYNVSSATISGIRLGRTWTYITNFEKQNKKFSQISKDTVIKIVDLHNKKLSNKEIFEKLNVPIPIINDILKGKRWASVTNFKRIDIPNKTKVVQLNLEGDLLNTFNSQVDAGKYLNLEKFKCISDCCRHRQNTAYGYKWMYYDEYINMKLQ